MQHVANHTAATLQAYTNMLDTNICMVYTDLVNGVPDSAVGCGTAQKNRMVAVSNTGGVFDLILAVTP